MILNSVRLELMLTGFSRVLVVLIFFCSALALSVAQQHQEAPSPVPEENAELLLWSTAPGLDEVADLFRARYKVGVKLRTFSSGTELYRNLQQAYQTGEGIPDVARVEYAFIPWLERSKGLLPLPQTSVFAPWANGQVSSLGEVYAIPQDIGAVALLYRQDMLTRYNLPIPRTWADFARVGQGLAKQTNNQVKLVNFERSSLLFASLLWAQGGRLWSREESGYTQTLDSALAKQLFSYWGGLIRQGQVTTMSEYSVEHWNALRSGRLFSAIVPAWALSAFARNLEPAMAKGATYALTMLPNAGRASSGNLGGSSFVVARGSQFPNAATAFALFASTSADAIAQLWTKETRLPAMTTAFVLPELSQQPTSIFGANPVELYRQASSVIPERFDWSPWLPTADAVYRKLFDAALENKISFGQLPALWQKQTLELAWRDGFAVR